MKSKPTRTMKAQDWGITGLRKGVCSGDCSGPVG